jgi:hypothetical protein
VERGQPIGYASRQLSSAKKKLTVTEKQLLAVIPGTKQFRYYLNDQPFGLVTDHRTVC